MAGINFFVNWELWQQMTFVLAAAIVVVFFIGLLKLWWMSRYLKKHTILDEEKRVRQEEMRKSGLPVGRRIDIPFGVRAIQSGIEVDGIWISQPGTPVEVGSLREASSVSDSESALKGKGKGKAAKVASGGVLNATTNAVEVQPTPKQSPLASPTGSLFDATTDVESSTQVTPPLKPQTISRPAQQRLADIGSSEAVNLDTLTRLERKPPRAPVETYMPTNSLSSVKSSMSSHQKTIMGRNSGSSDEGITYTTPHQTPTRIDRSTNHPRSLVAETAGPIETGWRTGPHQPLASDRPVPVRSYNVDTYANTTRRQVNAGFEVLPAGTFGTSNSDGSMEDSDANKGSHMRFSASTRLQKKSRDRPSSRGQ
ncbi:hypothetical protein F5X96DRAFT_354327 [Biscogniauxia mediterranea]|nr:hypothetical protein F5X96DRAFT_354327 [Biscogniauxia mediterranea]